MRYPKEISIILPLMTQMFSDDIHLPIHLGYTIKLGLIFSLGLHLNPYVLCEISIGSADESMLFGNNLYEMLMLSYKFLPGRIS